MFRYSTLGHISREGTFETCGVGVGIMLRTANSVTSVNVQSQTNRHGVCGGRAEEGRGRDGVDILYKLSHTVRGKVTFLMNY